MKQIIKALARMVIEYGGSSEMDAINPRMKDAQNQAIKAIADAGFAGDKGFVDWDKVNALPD